MSKSAGILVVTTMLSCAATAHPASFRSYSESNRILRQRLFEPNARFQLDAYLGQSYSESGSNLLDLLGTYEGDDLASKFKYGSPNSANMLIWHILMASLARDVSRQCAANSMDLRKDFMSAVSSACKWPSAAARSSEALENLWTLVMGYDAPESEFLIWKDFILAARFASSEEAVFSMMLSITCNPYFLLRD